MHKQQVRVSHLCLPCGELNLGSSGVGGREGHVHGREGLGIVVHVPDAHQTGHVILVDLKRVH